jgi:hypothetical protein
MKTAFLGATTLISQPVVSIHVAAGVLNLLEFARERDALFLQASTSEAIRCLRFFCDRVSLCSAHPNASASGIWRSSRASSTRDLLGSCELHRHQSML